MPDRQNKAVLVPAAQTMGSVGVIRSLGSAGYEVHAVATDRGALGLQSSFASRSSVCPPLGNPEFAGWFEAYVAKHNIRLVIPGGGIAYGNHEVFEAYEHLFPTSKDPETMAIAASKYDLFRSLRDGDPDHGLNLPPYLLVDLNGPLPAIQALGSLGIPLFVKLDAQHALDGGGSDVKRFETAEDAHSFLESLRGKYRKVLVQGFVDGKGVGAFLLRWHGKSLARCMHLRLHEVPHSGGASSLRKSWWHEQIMADAERKLQRVRWQGVAMVEYRWNPKTDRFYLMEMNLRFWGSLHLALYSGVDFPLLLADAFFGETPASMLEGKTGVICRNTIPNEVSYLISLLRDPMVPASRKAYAVAEAIALSVNPRVRTDLWYPGDRLLYFRRLFAWLRDPVRT